MELVERYLHTVKTFLPASQKSDIVAELDENIRSEIEEREAELGHPLDEAEQVAILRKHGNPFLAGSQYGKRRTLSIGHELIGPELFPFYVKVLAGSIAVAVAMTTAVRWAFSIPFSVAPYVTPVTVQLAVITMLFSMVQACQHKFHLFDQWTPASLWPRKQPNRVPYSTSIAEIVFATLFLIWWGPMRHFAVQIFGPNGMGIALAPVWQSVAPLMVGQVVVEIARACVNLTRPDWVRFCGIVRTMTDLAGLVTVTWLLGANTLVTASGAASNFQQIVKMGNRSVTVMQIVNGSVELAIAIAGACFVANAIVTPQRYLRRSN